MNATEDTCRVVEVDGELIRVHGGAPMTPEDVGYLTEIIQAARRRFNHEGDSDGHRDHR